MTVKNESDTSVRYALINKRTVHRMLGGVSTVALAFAMSSAQAADRDIDGADGPGDISVGIIHDNVNILGTGAPGGPTNANSVVFEVNVGNGGGDSSPVEIESGAILTNGIEVEEDAQIQADDIFLIGSSVFTEAVAVDDQARDSVQVNNHGLIDSYARSDSTRESESEASAIRQNSLSFFQSDTREEVDNHDTVNAKAQSTSVNLHDSVEARSYAEGIQQGVDGEGNNSTTAHVDNSEDGVIKAEADSLAVTDTYYDDLYADAYADAVGIEQHSFDTNHADVVVENDGGLIWSKATARGEAADSGEAFAGVRSVAVDQQADGYDTAEAVVNTGSTIEAWGDATALSGLYDEDGEGAYANVEAIGIHQVAENYYLGGSDEANTRTTNHDGLVRANAVANSNLESYEPRPYDYESWANANSVGVEQIVGYDENADYGEAHVTNGSHHMPGYGYKDAHIDSDARAYALGEGFELRVMGEALAGRHHSGCVW